MKVTTEELERCEVLMTVELEPQQEQKMLQKAAKEIARQVRIPGFRPGKAPYNVIVRRFGSEAVQQEALEKNVDKIIRDALEEAQVEPFAQIKPDSINWNPLVIKLKIPTRPKVELGDYKAIRLDSEPVEITDEDVAERLEDLQAQTAVWTPIDRPAEVGDMLTMSVVEKDGDTILNQQDSIQYELTPPEEDDETDTFLIDLTTPLLGLSDGEEKTFTITYPEDFSDNRYAGKEVTFEVKVSSVKSKEVDPIDDEFAKTVSDFDTLAELKADIRQKLQEQRQTQQNNELGNKALDEIIENATIEWPQAYEDESVDEEVKGFKRQMQVYGLNLENYLQMENKTEEEFVTETRERVIKQLRRNLALSKIIELEELEVAETEILDHAKRIADYSGRGEQFWRDILASPSQQNYIANELLVTKAISWLAAIAKGEDPAAAEAAAAEAAAAAAVVETAEGEEKPEIVSLLDAEPEDPAEVADAAAAAVVAAIDIEEQEQEEVTAPVDAEPETEALTEPDTAEPEAEAQVAAPASSDETTTEKPTPQA